MLRRVEEDVEESHDSRSYGVVGLKKLTKLHGPCTLLSVPVMGVQQRNQMEMLLRLEDDDDDQTSDDSRS